MKLKDNDKGQGLPLNTIVIAILVIVVLVVIVLAFTTQIGDFNDQVNDQTTSTCSISNPAISTIYPELSGNDLNVRSSCEPDEEQITGISMDDEQVCCIVADAPESDSYQSGGSANGIDGAENIGG